MKLNILLIVILCFFVLFVTGQAYAPCIEGPGINCNNYPPPSLAQIKFDKLNYETSDKPIVTIIGAPNAVTHLEIDDLSSNIMFTHDINLAPNGTVNYVLDISSYKPGAYSVIATSLISKLTTSFTVDLIPAGGHMFLNTDKNSYLPRDHVIILGAMNPNTLVQLFLIDPNGIPVESAQTFSDNTGHFSLFNFTIPTNAISGVWKIGATRGVEHVQIQITVNSTLDGNSNIKVGTVTPSPFKQFKSGIAAKDVTCKTSLKLIIKAEDNSPICVKSDTAITLIKRGWAMSSLKNFDYDPGRDPVSIESKESRQFSSIGPNPFPPSTWSRLVFFIKSNSTAQIYVQYTSEFENTGNIDIGGQFYAGNPYDFIPLNSSQITILSSPDHVSMSYGTNTTVIYTISTKNVTSGLYWIFLTQICGVMPVAIDMNSSQIASSDIPVYSQHCPAQVLNAKISGISNGIAEYMQSQKLQ